VVSNLGLFYAFRHHARTSKNLAAIQEDCRRFAAEVGDREAARILYRLADNLEQQPREVDTDGHFARE
jgi:hypothetical protein